MVDASSLLTFFCSFFLTWNRQRAERATLLSKTNRTEIFHFSYTMLKILRGHSLQYEWHGGILNILFYDQ